MHVSYYDIMTLSRAHEVLMVCINDLEHIDENMYEVSWNKMGLAI